MELGSGLVSTDPTGNWANYLIKSYSTTLWDEDRTHNQANEITELDGSSTLVAHDAAGNMTKVPQPGDWTDDYVLSYDAWNRLVTVEDGANTVAEYQYDALNRRIAKKIYSGGELDETRHLYYSRRWQVLEERVDSATVADRQYVWGARYVDDLVVRDRDADSDSQTGDLGKADSGLEERLYAMQDPNWNVVALASAAGSVQERYSYTAYGTPEIRTSAFADRGSSNHDWTNLYTGREYDPETGLYHYRNRPYGANLGRFPSRDPLGYVDRPNLFAYVRSNPLAGLDALGLADQCRKGDCRIANAEYDVVGVALTINTGTTPLSVTQGDLPKDTLEIMKEMAEKFLEKVGTKLGDKITGWVELYTNLNPARTVVYDVQISIVVNIDYEYTPCCKTWWGGRWRWQWYDPNMKMRKHEIVLARRGGAQNGYQITDPIDQPEIGRMLKGALFTATKNLQTFNLKQSVKKAVQQDVLAKVKKCKRITGWQSEPEKD